MIEEVEGLKGRSWRGMERVMGLKRWHCLQKSLWGSDAVGEGRCWMALLSSPYRDLWILGCRSSAFSLFV